MTEYLERYLAVIAALLVIMSVSLPDSQLVCLLVLNELYRASPMTSGLMIGLY